jgi:low affinity Fe/Cu permease
MKKFLNEVIIFKFLSIIIAVLLCVISITNFLITDIIFYKINLAIIFILGIFLIINAVKTK